MSALEYLRIEEESFDDKEWAELEKKAVEHWITLEKPKRERMKAVLLTALCFALLFCLGKGFIVVKSIFEGKDVVGKGFTDADVTEILNQLAAADVNGAQNGDITLAYQNQASHHNFGHDNAPNPLFTSVSSSLLSKSSYTSLASMLSLYTTPDSGADETLSTAKQRMIVNFLGNLSTSDVYKKGANWLAANNLVRGSNFATFLTGLWFDPFARIGSVKGSSGFKYTFAGETSDGKVIGFNNWFQFYTLEKAGNINYHGWFERQKDVQISLQFAWDTNEAMIRNFLIGTSPEFDLLSYTICGLAGSGTDNSHVCTFTLKGYPVTLTVETLTVSGNTFISTANPSIGSGTVVTTPSSHTSGTHEPTVTSNPTSLQSLVDQMWSSDEDKAQPGDVVLDWGNKVSGSSDTSSGPLFVKVNETLFERPVYSKLIDIFNAKLFHPAVCTAEPAITGSRKTQLDDYMKTLTNTTVFQLAYQYLVQQGSASSDFSTFYNQLFNLWYGTYTRCKGPLGSSGWEHVYSGEWKNEEIDGQHNWVRYYLLEKAGDINYHGYYSHENDLIGTFQYEWSGNLKKKGGFFISTSPSFDLSIMTVCVLIHPGANACKFNLDGNKISITSYHQSCDVGTCISTDYPSDE